MQVTIKNLQIKSRNTKVNFPPDLFAKINDGMTLYDLINTLQIGNNYVEIDKHSKTIEIKRDNDTNKNVATMNELSLNTL